MKMHISHTLGRCFLAQQRVGLEEFWFWAPGCQISESISSLFRFVKRILYGSHHPSRLKYIPKTVQPLQLHPRCHTLPTHLHQSHPIGWHAGPRCFTGSPKGLNCHGALLLLLKMLQRNPGLLQGILRQVEISDWMSMLLFVYNDTEQQRGIIKPAMCLLLQMSQSDSFCRVLNLPFTSKLPSALPQTVCVRNVGVALIVGLVREPGRPGFTPKGKPSRLSLVVRLTACTSVVIWKGGHGWWRPLLSWTLQAGTRADVLVVILDYIMNLHHDWLKPRYEQFLTILYNISPHCNLKSVAAASRLMQLYAIFSSPKVLVASPPFPLLHLVSST